MFHQEAGFDEANVYGSATNLWGNPLVFWKNCVGLCS
jgi:hypothetical protein